MINFQTYASGSSANLYTIDDGRTRIMIEMGLPIKEIKKALNFELSGISGALLSHAHDDHAHGAADVLRAGVDVYTSPGTVRALDLSGHRIKPVSPGKQFTIGTWTILPFEAQHDAPEPLSFLMANQDGDKFLFATDTFYIAHKFRGLTGMAVECNYSLPLLTENLESGLVPLALKNRILKSHFSLDNVKKFLAANDLSGVREIHLIHLSSTNADPAFFKSEIERLTGKPTVTH